MRLVAAVVAAVTVSLVMVVDADQSVDYHLRGGAPAPRKAAVPSLPVAIGATGVADSEHAAALVRKVVAASDNESVPDLAQGAEQEHQLDMSILAALREAEGALNRTNERVGAPSPQRTSCRNQAIVLRTYDSLPETLILDYAKAALIDSYDFWILYDKTRAATDTVREYYVSNIHSVLHNIEEEAELPHGTIQFFAVDDNMLADFYPTTNSETWHTLVTGPHSIGYAMHTPFVCLWMAKTECKYKHVWVLEDDVRFTGDPLVFFDFYRSSNYDLLSEYDDTVRGGYMLRDDQSEIGPGWAHRNDLTWKLPDTLKVKKREHVERYSARLLHFIHDLVTLNVAAYGEMFGSSVCLSLDWCGFHNIQDDGFIGRFYEDKTTVSSVEWNVLWQVSPNKWFHALKWLKPPLTVPDLPTPAPASHLGILSRMFSAIARAGKGALFLAGVA